LGPERTAALGADLADEIVILEEREVELGHTGRVMLWLI
jgi:hypothetical protein